LTELQGINLVYVTLLLALLEANGSLVSKQQLLARVWPGIAVAEVVAVFAKRPA
jgi:DNA-binding winged helix-turn-helix (wHTH) protein